MSKNRNMFRSALDAMIESRMAQANRQVAEYRALFDMNTRTEKKR